MTHEQKKLYFTDEYGWNLPDLSAQSSQNAITSVEESAFAGCTSLKNIKLPSKLKTIGYNCFGSWSNLKCGLESISIPNTVTSIVRESDFCQAFLQCDKNRQQHI